MKTMKEQIVEILRDQVSIRSTKSCAQIAEEIEQLFAKHNEPPTNTRELNAEEVLMENLIGVNKESIKKHFDFLPSVLRAMEQYAQSRTPKSNQ